MNKLLQRLLPGIGMRVLTGQKIDTAARDALFDEARTELQGKAGVYVLCSNDAQKLRAVGEAITRARQHSTQAAVCSDLDLARELLESLVAL